MIILIINELDLSKIDKFFNYKIINTYGVKKAIENIKHSNKQLICLFSIIILIFLYTRFIIKIEILTNNKELYNIVLNELDKESISNYTIIKSDKKIGDIKERILNKNKKLLEWINIRRVGMKYVVNIEPKVEKNKNNKNEYCNIIATKDAIITKIITAEGMETKDINDSVKKGDIIIAGDITYNEETKKQVCADGIVYGKTWYTINISLPKKYEKTIRLKKTRNNFLIKFKNKKYKIFKPRLKEYEEENKKITNIFGVEIYFQKEYEAIKKEEIYTESELEEQINKLVIEKMNATLEGEHKIIEQKVLKKTDNNSTIDIEIFIVAEEQISIQNYDKLNKTEE